MAEELWLGYKQNGEPDRPITKDEARSGVLHAASHVWVWRKHDNGTEVLVQQRAKDKLTWPGFFDISAAGHVDADETPVEAAVRESKEEINLEIEPDKLRLLFVRHADDDAGNGVRENEFMWVYLYEFIKSNEVLKHADDEVEGIHWMALDKLEKLSRNEIPGEKTVPHVYFPDLLAELRRL